MSLSRRQFLVTGGAALAVGSVPAWAEVFQAGSADDVARAEAADAALSRRSRPAR